MEEPEIRVKEEPISDDDDRNLFGEDDGVVDVKQEPEIDEELEKELEQYFDGSLNGKEEITVSEPNKSSKKTKKNAAANNNKQPKVKVERGTDNTRSGASHLGTLELRRMARAIHKRKQVVVKNFRIDETKEKTKQAFLRQLKALLVNEHGKVSSAHEALLPFQESVFAEKNDASDSAKDLKQIVAQQHELDKRQRLLAKQVELLKDYLEKQSKQSEKSLSASLQAQRKLTTAINDILALVNQTMMDRQAQENMYISAQNTRQDIYQNNTHSPLAPNPPLFRNYRTGQSGNSSEHDLKATVKLRSKKKEYILKSEK